jgi:predicted dehydrogenase
MQKNMNSNQTKLSRRDFLGGAATAAAAFTIVPSYVLGRNGSTPPSGKLNIASVGAGGMAGHNISVCGETENIVALCDVDDGRAAGTYNKFPQASKYRDFRKMLEKEEKNIDAVIVATPDHTHAVAAMMAIKMGKDVYVQKPMTHSVKEARMLTEAAREHKVITQMGNQGHSGEGIRLVCEWIWDGAIGKVREVHAWTNRPIWPQGIPRPKDTPAVPQNLAWDLWLGPAPQRPYHPVYAPFSWRGWWDFGTGALGDMACHIMDPVFWALKLRYPVSVEACTPLVNSEGFTLTESDAWQKLADKKTLESYPISSIVRYKFPARGDMPPVAFTWYDGGMMPPTPDELPSGRRMGDNDGGVLFVGDKGKLVCGCYGRSPRLLPDSLMDEFMQKRPDKTIPRVPGGEGGHEKDWIRACKDRKQPSSNFEYSGPLTETVVMGNLAIRTGKKIDWDGANIKVTNDQEANQFVHREYRKGWTL